MRSSSLVHKADWNPWILEEIKSKITAYPAHPTSHLPRPAPGRAHRTAGMAHMCHAHVHTVLGFPRHMEVFSACLPMRTKSWWRAASGSHPWIFLGFPNTSLRFHLHLPSPAQTQTHTQTAKRHLVAPSQRPNAINHRPMQSHWHAACIASVSCSEDVLDARPLFAFCSTEVH